MFTGMQYVACNEKSSYMVGQQQEFDNAFEGAYKPIDFRLSLWLIIDVDSVLGCECR
jgi:hypothetical protein